MTTLLQCEGERIGWHFRGASQCHYLVKVVSLGELKYKNLQGAFYGCKKLTHFIGGDSKLSTKKVTSMSFMFSGAKKLEYVDVSNFETVEVKTYQSMFEGAKSLRTLDLGSFNGDKAKNMKRMFKGASALYAINLKGMYWFLDYDDFRKKVSVDEMFANTPKLKLNNILTTGAFLHEVAKEQK